MNGSISPALIVTGTRPEILKMAPVYQALRRQDVAVSWSHTGQHEQLADQTFDSFEIEPSFTAIRPKGLHLSGLVAALLQGIEELLHEEPWRMVLVQGDTSSTLAGAMAAFHAQVPLIAHVEAGLRSGNILSPFPEESNRRIVADLANRHYAPTARAAAALEREGIDPTLIRVTGNTAVDAQRWLQEKYPMPPSPREEVLVTIHRRENWPHAPEIAAAVAELARNHSALRFIIPLHPNPELRARIEPVLQNIANVELQAPLDYLSLQKVLAGAALVITDSGGLQEEAPSYGVPCLVTRNETERPEAVEAGTAELVGHDPATIVAAGTRWLASERPLEGKPNPFGDGRAAERIAADLIGKEAT